MKNNLSEDEYKCFEGMDEVYTEMENKRSENNNKIEQEILKIISKKKYKRIIEYLEEDGSFDLEEIVNKDQIFGDKQDEDNYWFKYIYIQQSSGMAGDDFYGNIFFPLTKDKFLKVSFNC